MARGSKIFFQKPIEVESWKGNLEHAKRPAIVCFERKNRSINLHEQFYLFYNELFIVHYKKFSTLIYPVSLMSKVASELATYLSTKKDPAKTK